MTELANWNDRGWGPNSGQCNAEYLVDQIKDWPYSLLKKDSEDIYDLPALSRYQTLGKDHVVKIESGYMCYGEKRKQVWWMKGWWIEGGKQL